MQKQRDNTAAKHMKAGADLGRKGPDIPRIFLMLIAAVTPLLIAALLVAVSGHSIRDIIPYYVGGDAVARYDYIRNILDHGRLLGYNGYDFVTARIPSLGSAWGFFWAIPYLAYGKIFGWGLNSPIMANLLFLCLANLIFILLTRADKKAITLVIVMSCLLYINVNYSISGMSEPSRYAAAIILTGMIYRLASFETGGFFKYFIVPLFIIYAASTFILLSAYIIPYCLIVIRTRRKLAKGIITLAAFGIITIAVKRTNSMFCTPYFQGFNMKKDIAAFREGLVPGIRTVISTSLNNLRQFSVGALSDLHYQHGQYVWFVGVCWLMTALFALMLLFRMYRSEKDKYILLGALYIMLVIIGGYVVLYNDDRTTLTRGINTALCAAVFLITLMDKRRAAAFYIILALAWSPFFVRNFMSMCNDDFRIPTAVELQDLEARRAVAAEYITLDPDADPWDNTVAIRFGGKNTAFVVPSGAGKVSMHKVTLNEKARYVLAGTSGDAGEIEAFINDHLANGHTLLVETDDFVILERTGD